MEKVKRIKSALISVFDKNGIDKIVDVLNKYQIKIYSTGGTFEFIKNLGIEATPVEDITSYPSILGGRVKTLHPKIFGGILGRRDNENDKKELEQYDISEIDLVIVDLYPFEKTLSETTDEEKIIEKIDIGGIALIRAAAKNFKDVLVVSSCELYDKLLVLLNEKNGSSSLRDRKYFATHAFNISSHYDTAIFNYFNKEEKIKIFKQSIKDSNILRYGENPHQEGIFYGKLDRVFEQLHGKAISYNNINDLDSAINLIDEFKDISFAILKHSNACGLASRLVLVEAWKAALAGDSVSAFGGVLITNETVDEDTAKEINKLFFEIILAPDYSPEALNVLKTKKNRIILKRKYSEFPERYFKSVLNGILEQGKDLVVEKESDMKVVTERAPSDSEKVDLLFANKIVKHTKSNAIVLVKNKQLIASGMGQTSRVEALKQAIAKAGSFGFNLDGVVMASDAFFPFADSVEIAHKTGIKAVIQPGGSIRDQDSVDYCNKNGVSMVFTGIRHFKH